MLEPMDEKISSNNDSFNEIKQILESSSNNRLSCDVEIHKDSPDYLRISHTVMKKFAFLVFDGRKILISFQDGRVLNFPPTLSSSDVELIENNFEYNRAVGV